MKEREAENFAERLNRAERPGMAAVQEACTEEMRRCGTDGEKLAELANHLSMLSAEALMQGEAEKSGRYDVMADEVTQYAMAQDPGEYHRFCRKLSGKCLLKYP